MAERPLILVCNDDGIKAPGIRKLVAVMNEIGEVVVVAPDSPQSGMGHAITIEGILRCDPIFIDDGPQKDYQCSGTPVDCIKLAVNVVLDRKPDLVVSGINHGSNASINVIYSGTMSAAMEGCLEGIPSIGFSLCDFSHAANFDPALPYIKRISEKILAEGLPQGVVLNVNIPKYTGKDYKGFKLTRQCRGNWEEEFDERTDPRGKKYFWLTGKFVNYDEGMDHDEQALADYYLSVVPVSSDLTAKSAFKFISNWNL
jgi:5'-nucleotidase